MWSVTRSRSGMNRLHCSHHTEFGIYHMDIISEKIKLKLLPHPHSWQAVWLGKLAYIVTQNHISTIGGTCHKYHFCCNKKFVVTNMCLWQHVFCHDKQNFCCDKIMFVMTKYFCCNNFRHDKHMFVATKFCCNKNGTCGSSCQSYISRQVKKTTTKTGLHLHKHPPTQLHPNIGVMYSFTGQSKLKMLTCKLEA